VSLTLLSQSSVESLAVLSENFAVSLTPLIENLKHYLVKTQWYLETALSDSAARWYHWVRQIKICDVLSALDTIESYLSSVNNATKWKLCGLVGIESLKTLQSIVKAFEGSGSYFLWRNVKPNPSKSELYFKDFQTKPFQWGQLKEFFVTQRCHWLHQVIFIFVYVGAFKVMCENTVRYETVAQGKMFNEKTRGEKLFENLYSWQFH
jgi:hypothetical protein